MSTLILDVECTTCKGERLVINPAWDAWFGRDERNAPEPDEPEEIPCNDCHGIGYRPTPEGQTLLDFVLRHRGTP